MMSKHWTILAVTSVIVLLAMGAWIWRKATADQPLTPRGGEPDARSPSADQTSSRLDDLRKDAFKLQVGRKWPDAEKAWRKYLAELPPGDAHDDEREEAQRNLELCTRQGRGPVAEAHIPEPTADDRPEKVSDRDVKAWYPKGRKIRSFAVASATGRGRTTAGIFQKPAYFAYQYLFELETTVLDNDGVAVEFEIAFRDVVQQLARCDEELELHLPDSPILDAVWNEAENYLRPIPAYRLLKTIAEIEQAADPHFKVPLTKFHEWLKLKGVKPLGEDVSVMIAARVDELAGLRLQLRYVSGIGITQAKVLEGRVTDRGALERLARNSSLFADYFVGLAAEKTEGETVELRADDVVGILALGYDVEASGAIMLRKAGLESQAEDKWIKLIVERGEVTVDSPEANKSRSVTVRPRQGGAIWFSPAQKLVRRAKLGWAATAYWESPNSLLFGMQYEGEVGIKTDYWAEPK